MRPPRSLFNTELDPSDLVKFNSDPTHWRLRSMSVAPIRFDSTIDAVVTPSEDVNCPRSWRFAQMPSLNKDPRYKDFSRVKPQSFVLADESRVSDYLDIGRRLNDSLDLPDPEELPTSQVYDDNTLIRASERSSFSKLTIQKGTLPTWHLDLPRPGSPSPEGLFLFRKAATRVAQEYRSVSDGSYLADAPPSDTVGGWPSYVSGGPAKVLSSCFASRTMSASEWLDEAKEWAFVYGLPPDSALGYGLGGRSGPLKKPQVLWKYDIPGGWRPYVKVAGVSQRNRIVYMAPAGLNTALWDFYITLKDCQVKIPGMWRDGNDENLLRGHPFRYEADVSGFDTSISSALFDVVESVLVDAFPHLSDVINNWRVAERLPLITPPLFPSRGWGCGIRRMDGGLRSGLITTSVMGSFIQRSLVTMALMHQGRDLGSSDVIATIHGDDVALACDKPLDGDAWAESYSLLGMKCSLVPGLCFLSRHITKEGLSLPVAGRLIQQTCSNENELTGGRWVIGILAQGFLSRFDGLLNLPSDLQAAVHDGIRPVYWLQYFRGSTLHDTFNRVERSSGRLIDIALRKREGVEWIVNELRSLEHSAVGRRLASAFPSLVKGSIGFSTAIFQICRHVNQLPREKRLKYASAGLRSVLSTQRAATRWLSEVVHSESINI